MRHDRKVDVVFSTPTLDHRMAMEYTRSLLETTWMLWEKGYVSAAQQRGGDCFVAKVRNKLVTDFLLQFPDCENFFFIDEDVGWPAHKAVEFINRPEDIVAGIYPRKSEEVDFPVEFAFDEETGQIIEQNGLTEAWIIPTGFMRIKRHVLQKMADAYGTFKDMDIENGKGVIKNFYNIFECGPNPADDGLFWGEDYTFCKKWRAMGGKMWVDTNIDFTHRGPRKWKANMSEHMQIIRDKAANLKKPNVEYMVRDKDAAE